MPFLPHNLPFTIAGAGMLWVGWFGFNGGSQTAANGAAGMTIVVTHLSASAAALTWMAIEWFRNGKPSALGIATGSIAGLAAVTPAAGFVAPAGALAIGAISAALCWFCCSKLKHRFRYDDSLDVFGVHGIGGIVGTVLVAVFGSASMGGFGQFDIGTQLVTQCLAAVYTAGLSGVVTWVLLSVLRRTIGLRVDEAAEAEGLDISEHGETAYSVQ
jgi:Amt family ammonium transporter